MTYRQTLDYLYQQLPMFHRIGAAAYKADLSNTISLCKILNNPERNFPSIHIAGTNGKGSTSHFLASIFQEAGYKTGLFTSPHLKDFRERIRVNGKMISKKEVVSFVGQYQQEFEAIQPSFFEWTFALAAWYFAKEKVEIAVIETGMGGRLDSTNVISPVVTAITNIGFDHTQFLGNTLTAIASEKAGIIKPHIPVIIGESQQETTAVFSEFCQANHSELIFADQHIILQHSAYSRHRPPLLQADFYSNLSGTTYTVTSPLSAKYQLKNLVTVLAIIEKIQHAGYSIDNKDVAKGIRHVVKNTGLMGRWQTIARHPHTIADIGHNPEGIRQLLQQLYITPHNKLHFVIGVVNDKDVNSMLDILPKYAFYYFCKANIPRGLDQMELKSKAAQYSLKGDAFTSVHDAFAAARQAANPDDLVIVSGSAFVVAEVV